MDIDGDGTVTVTEFERRFEAPVAAKQNTDKKPREDPYEMQMRSYSEYLTLYRASDRCPLIPTAVVDDINCANVESEMQRLVKAVREADSEEQTAVLRQQLYDYCADLLHSVVDVVQLENTSRDVPIFELLLLLHRRGPNMGGPTCGGISSARDAALVLTNERFGSPLNLAGTSTISPYSIVSDILV